METQPGGHSLFFYTVGVKCLGNTYPSGGMLSAYRLFRSSLRSLVLLILQHFILCNYCLWRADCLVAQAKPCNQSAIAVWAFLAYIFKQSPSLTDHHQQTSTRVEVVFMDFKMFCKLINAPRQDRYLYFRRSRISFMDTRIRNNLCLFFWNQCHACYYLPSSRIRRNSVFTFAASESLRRTCYLEARDSTCSIRTAHEMKSLYCIIPWAIE